MTTTKKWFYEPQRIFSEYAKTLPFRADHTVDFQTVEKNMVNEVHTVYYDNGKAEKFFVHMIKHGNSSSLFVYRMSEPVIARQIQNK